MKIQQENLPFRPITIKLEKFSEAEAMLALMNMVCDCVASVDKEITPDDISADERALAVAISDAFTERKVIY